MCLVAIPVAVMVVLFFFTLQGLIVTLILELNVDWFAVLPVFISMWLLCFPRIIEKFLERQCFLGTVPDVTNVPNSDQFVRKAILDSQVS